MASLIWTEPAISALEEIADYIALEDYDAARRFVQRVFDKIDLLEKNPGLGNRPRVLRKTPYRRLVIKPACVYYRIEENTVVILFVERSERDFHLSRLEG